LQIFIIILPHHQTLLRIEARRQIAVITLGVRGSGSSKEACIKDYIGSGMVSSYPQPTINLNPSGSFLNKT